jgi:hypothetical protein
VTIAGAFVARWCGVERIEIVDGVYRVRDHDRHSDDASLRRTPWPVLGFSPMGTRRRFLGWVPYQGLGTPSIYRPSVTATSSASHQGPGPASLLGATVGWIVPPIWSPFWKRGGAVLSHRFNVRNKSTEAAGQPWCRNLSSHRGSRTTLRGTSRRRTGFAKQEAGNVEKGEAPPLLWEFLEIRFHENLDGLFAGMDLDAKGRVAEVNLMPSSVSSSNDGIGHQSSRFQCLVWDTWCIVFHDH